MNNYVEMQQLYEELVEPFVNENSEFVIRKARDNQDYNAMTCVPAFVGDKFSEGEVSLMLVGRAVNGWSAEWNGDAKAVAEQALNIQFNMSDIDAKQPLNENTPDEYNFNRCAFMRLGKDIARKLGLKTDTAAEHLMWSNLYKVAPILSGNPNGTVQKLQRQAAIKILQKEIELHKPSHILFVTDIDWLQATWRNSKTEMSFAKAFDISEETEENNWEYVKASGFYNEIPYVVCVRPEKIALEMISRDIISAYELLEEKNR